jgi:putative nucleotidyltransferase with HDIG domain
MDEVFADVAAIIEPVYLVGGSVRDILLGREPKDYDFTTPLTPDEVEAAIKNSGRRTFNTGKRFGTIGFRLHNHHIEVTTFRSEIYKPGSRKPEVDFVGDITHDLSRRDFTINAIAQRPDGRIIDPFDGRADLKARVIRTVGKPEERFREDPLRMLRAARFASQLNFTIDAETEHRTDKRNYHVLEVSRERWTQELDKLLTSDHPEIGLNFLARSRLLNYLLPELAIQVGWDHDSPYHALELWDHTVKTVRLAPNDINLRWAALLHDVGKPYVRTKNRRGYSNYVHHAQVGAEIAEKIGRYLKWSNDRIATVKHLVLHHLEDDSPLMYADGEATKAD